MSDSPNTTPHPLIALRLNHKDTYDAVAMFVYLILVYGWGLWIFPLGRDYRHLADFGANLPFLARHLFTAEVAVFGANPVGYHVVNLALMYACMLLVYHFINKSVRGLWWFGSLAACLFMANPVHGEAMHNLSGVGDLVPCLAGLAALTAYAWNAEAPSAVRLFTAVSATAFAAGAYIENAALGAVLLAYELLVVRKGSRSVGRGVLFCAIASPIALIADSFRAFGGFDFRQMFAPLYLIFYPIGFLPKTVESFHERTWAVWLSVAAIVFVIALVHRKARRPEFLFAIAGMFLLRIVPSTRPIDLTHMVGGGQLLLPNVLFVLGFIIIVFRIMDHPRWRVPMISITTTLVIVFFAMQWRTIKIWHDAGQYVRQFQVHAAKATERGKTVGVLPDFRYHRGAPLCLSDSISYETPFSKRIAHVPLLPIHPPMLAQRHMWVKSWTEYGGEVTLPKVAEAPLYAYFPNAERIAPDTPTELTSVWGDSMPVGTFGVTRRENGELRVTLQGDGWPTTLLPGNIAGKEANGESEPDADDQ